MIRTTTSLRDRGLQMLGIGRPTRDDITTADAVATPDIPLGSESRSPGRSAASRISAYSAGAAAPTESEAELRHIWDIENLLSAEAEAARGGDTPATPPTTDTGESVPLPATEWISPLPPAPSRPLPAPPPQMTTDQEHTPPGAGSASVDSASLVPVNTPPAAAPPSAQPAPEQQQPATTLTPYPAPLPEHTPRSPGATTPNPDLLPVPRAVEGMTPPMNPPRSVPLTDAQVAELLQRPDVQERLGLLSRAIQTEYDRILRDNVSANNEITDWCHGLLAEARVIVTYREMGALAKAEWCVEQVRTRLDRAQQSAEEVRAPVLITLWGILWFFLFVYLIVDPMRVLEPFGLSSPVDSFIRPEVFLHALFFGGLGGVAAVFYHLFRHVRNRSFDNKHVLSYVGKPFMGMILGAMIYLSVFVAMRILGLTPVGVAGSESESLTQLLPLAFLYLAATAIGFKENLAFSSLNRTVKAIVGDDEVKAVAAPQTDSR